MKVKVNTGNDADAVRNPRRIETGVVDNLGREAASSSNVKTPSPAATLNVFASGSKIEEMTNVLKNMPAVRAEQVETLRTRIAQGEFNPSAETIADRILTSLD